jgi:hypothetical protein
VRETNRPVVRRGIYYFMTALGVEPNTRDWSKGTTGAAPTMSPNASYQEFFEGWKETGLQKVQDDPSITKAIIQSSPLNRASNIAVLNGLGLDSKAAAAFIESKKKYQLAYETLKQPTVGDKNFFDLQEGLASATVPQQDPQPFPEGGVPDELTGILPPATATIAVGSVKVTFDSSLMPPAQPDNESKEGRRKRFARERMKRCRDKKSNEEKAKEAEGDRLNKQKKRNKL